MKLPRWALLLALVLVGSGSLWTISAQTGVGRDIFLPLVNSGATAVPVPTDSTVPQTPTPALIPTPTTPASTPVPPAVPPEDAASARLSVPPGFAVRIYASGLAGPRLMAIGPDGALYVAERGASRVVRLADANNDGLADAVQPVATNLSSPHSVDWYQGELYVAEAATVARLTDTNGDGDFLDAGEKTSIVTGISTDGSHSSRTARIGPDGYLYVAAGSTGNNNVETDKRRAAISRFNLDGSIPGDNPYANDPDPSRRAVWAEGLRNSVDFLWMPNGQLWADHNGSDLLGDDKPPEEIVINVAKGGFYGWPYCYTAQLGVVPPGAQEVNDPAYPSFNCAAATPAMLTDLAHQAPLGLARYDQAQFPAQYQGNLFVAYHGSWNTNNPANYRDCKVQMITVQDNKPTGATTFLNGFREPGQKCGSAWGRPAGVAVGANGELFVSDDKNGNIYRIVYVGS